MSAQMAQVRMSRTCPMEIDIDYYPHARRMAIFIVGIIFCLFLQIIIQVVTLVCKGDSSAMVAFALAGWSGIAPTLILGVVAARHMVLHRSDAMFLCKSFGWLLLAFKALGLLLVTMIFGIIDFWEIAINFAWVVAILAMIWSQYGSSELMQTFPRTWRVVTPLNVAAVVICALSMVGLPACLMAVMYHII